MLSSAHLSTSEKTTTDGGCSTEHSTSHIVRLAYCASVTRVNEYNRVNKLSLAQSGLAKKSHGHVYLDSTFHTRLHDQLVRCILYSLLNCSF